MWISSPVGEGAILALTITTCILPPGAFILKLMTTLTKIAYYTRRGVIAVIIGIISLFILKTLVNIGIREWKRSHPTAPSPPNVLFGKLPKIKFPKSEYPYPQQFILETVGGEIPEASPAAKVYQIPKRLPSLLAARHAQEFANRLGFKKKPVSKTPTKYKFEHPKTPLKTLDLDIINYNFSLKYDFSKDPEVLKEKNLPLPQRAKVEAERFLQTTGIFPEDLQKGEKKVSFLKLSGGKLLPTTSLSKADAVRVDFLRSRVEDYPILPPKFEEAGVFVVFSGAKEEEKRIILAEFNFFEVNYKNSATYPIKTPKEAWEELKGGRGFISKWKKGKGQVMIRKIYLAYYDPQEYQGFLQPIFVFQGDQGFVGYIPAVKEEWTE